MKSLPEGTHSTFAWGWRMELVLDMYFGWDIHFSATSAFKVKNKALKILFS